MELSLVDCPRTLHLRIMSMHLQIQARVWQKRNGITLKAAILNLKLSLLVFTSTIFNESKIRHLLNLLILSLKINTLLLENYLFMITINLRNWIYHSSIDIIIILYTKRLAVCMSKSKQQGSDKRRLYFLLDSAL